MNNFEDFINRVSRLRSKDEAISIHRTAVYIERFNTNKHDLDYLLLDVCYYNALKHYMEENPAEILIDDMSVVWHFRSDPAYAEKYLQVSLLDNNKDEISTVSQWYKLAHALGPIRKRVLRKV